MGKQSVLAIELPATVYNSNGTFFEFTYRPTQQDHERMGKALDFARLAMSQGDNPIGAVLCTPFGEYPAETREHVDYNSEAHAEKRSYQMAVDAARLLEEEKPRHGREPFGLHLGKCVLYSTAELCVGCSHLYDQVEIGMVIIATTRRDTPDFFRDKVINQRSIWQQSPRTLTVVEGLRRLEAKELLRADTKKHE